MRYADIFLVLWGFFGQVENGFGKLIWSAYLDDAKVSQLGYKEVFKYELLLKTNLLQEGVLRNEWGRICQQWGNLEEKHISNQGLHNCM